MKKKIVVASVLVLMLVGTFGAFAAGETKSKEIPWMASYDNPGQWNLYAAVGFYGFGVDLNFGPEVMVAKFEPGGVPLELGITARGLIGFSSVPGYVSWVDWAVAPMVTLHWGVDFGGAAKFSAYIGAGLSISGTTGVYYSYSGVGFGFASDNGIAWHFANNFALIVDYAYTPYISSGGIGIKWSL